jgi:hypothetical protein
MQNYDAVFKESFTLFKDKSLRFLGIESDARITEILSTEKREIQVDTEFSDLTFKTDKGFGLHIEEETNISKQDLYRFCGYQVDLAQRHGIDFETLVLTFSAPGVKQIETPTLVFRPWLVNLKERDADLLLEDLSDKVGRGEEISELDLVFLPMCSSRTKTTVELLGRGIALAARLPSRGQKIAGLMMVLSNRLVEEKELERIWGEFMDMTKLKVFQVAEKVGREQGIELGKEQTAISLLKEGMDIPFISKVTGLSPEALQKLASKAS